MNNRLKVPALLSVIVALPILVNGCSDSADNPLCCNEFKVGGTITADIGGSAQSQVAAQAVADVAAIGAAAIEDLTAACRGIAEDLDASTADRDGANAGKDSTERMNAWCNLAVKQIGAVKASANVTIKVAVTPPKCEASISAKADCQAKCSGSAKCDLKANPPKCTGGKLTVACKGECTAEAGASVQCEGECTGNCEGSCTAQGGVECTGKCEGTCEASASGGTGSGIQADGTCKGTCKGTCSVTPPGVKCSGSCNGKCSASCKASANAAVKCDGKCNVDAEPLSCEGGTLEGGCKADVKCEGNCDASVQAKANCSPPSVGVVISGGADVTAVAKLKATLEANLPIVFRFKTKLEAVGKVTGSFTANIGAVADIKAACIPPLVAAAGDAIGDLKAAGEASVKITGSVGN